MLRSLLAGMLIAGTGAQAVSGAEGEAAPEELKSKPAVRLAMKQHPTLRAGDWLKVDFRAKVQMDFRDSSDSAESQAIFDPRRLRVGVEGRLLRDLEFELEFELLPKDYRLRDAFINYRRFRAVRLQAGKFKIPFGMDQLTGPTRLDFVYRSRIGGQLAPGRDFGVMVHGRPWESSYQYQLGVFRHDGENAEAPGNVRTGGLTAAARMRVAPFQFFVSNQVLRNFEAGAAMTYSDAAGGLNGLRGRTVRGETYFDRMFVKGPRLRQGLEASWRLGQLGLDAEWINARQQRRGQSLFETDLPELFARGWYVSATHPLFGRERDGKPERLPLGLVPGRNAGRLEAAVRYEAIRFGSQHSGVFAPSRSPRATNVLGNSERALTLGINWRATPHTRYQFNAVREVLEDAARFPVTGIRSYWTYVGRFQFTL